MSQQKVLIYENIDQDVQTIEYLCAQHSLERHCARNRQDAEKILETQPINIAIVNYALEKLNLKSDIAVVATGDPNTSATMHIVSYYPVCFIPKPLTFASVSLGLIKAGRSLCEPKSYPSTLVNVMTILADLQVKFRALVKDVGYNLTVGESMTQHCEEFCPFAKTGKEVREDVKSEGEYEVLNYFTSRGALFCKRKKVCELWDFHRWLKQVQPGLLEERPLNFLCEYSFAGKQKSFYEAMIDIIRQYNEKINLFYDLKIKYDTRECRFCKKDLNFQKGDHLFSKSEDIVFARNCAYCSEHECPLDKFFELFKRKVI